MLLADFDFNLPPELIAQEPLINRTDSRMLVVDRRANRTVNSSFADLPAQLSEGDLLVVNNTKVFPARLEGKTETGAAVEIFLVSEQADGSWTALAKPAKRLPTGKIVHFAADLSCEVVERLDDGKVRVKFLYGGDVYSAIDKYGRTPLPPYIKRDADQLDADRERYQTVYASDRGAIAAPTAGLHFSDETFRQLSDRGIETVEITLHVGYGTFEPVRVDNIAEHSVSPERFSITANAADVLNAARIEGRRIVAIGTTTTRALESSMQHHSEFRAGNDIADITILPGYVFLAVGALLTNFHLPKSSLLVLTTTFGGHDLIMNAYRHAVAERYRFYSYGDCMLIL
ncbi:MAG TPA: tRNA preQ1(34) S-adenosylmethionine ribosyltransferase-isomerase QueA [Pyrinomonadaceae bacterium]|nr:tRNA preQ1(34) S-adenosylmethionine ribosyltransferase-isomerase QueA [Pyrinomonadaceae bacterium]